MKTATLTKMLGGIAFAADLPDELIERLARIAHVRSYAAGDILFEEGTVNHELLLLWSGRVALDMSVPGHGNVRVLCLGPGDMAAWSAVLEQGQMTASAVATDDTVVVALPADRLAAECTADPRLGYEVMYRLARQVARRLLATRLQLVELLAATPEAAARRLPASHCAEAPAA